MPMTESILKALMRLFAIVTQIHPEHKLSQSRAIVESYLQQLVNPVKVSQYLIMFDFYHSSLREREVKTGEKQISLFSVKTVIICENINKILDQKQKLHVLMQLLEILNLKEVAQPEDIDFIRTISIAFKFDDMVFNSCKSFVLNSLYEIPGKENVLIIDSKNEINYTGVRQLYREFFKGKLVILHIEAANTYLFRNIEADDRLSYRGKEVIPYRTYDLRKGSNIKSPLIGTIYYSDIVKEFLKSKTPFKVNLAVEKVEFRFKNSDNGICRFNLYEESGVMVGIMGGSGVGKSTLLNLLNGNLKPRKGRVLINGYDIHKEKKEIEGIIGYIPQDDLLIEDLTVHQNLYFNAKLCFKNLAEDEILYRVHKILADLGLNEIKDLKVGSPLNKFISGGQRKRLNIALELIREPYILFVDEPTSGLSSADSEIVIDLLREQSLKGKLVIVNIHQPSSNIYKLFDRLIVMDRGGRIVFYGNPLDALIYFKTENQLINAEEGECPTCGNVSPDQVLQILESKKVNEFGEYISERQVSPEEWYESYIKKHQPPINLGAEIKSDLPSNDFEIPGKGKQLWIFTMRNVLSKLSDKQYMLINLLEAPLLAFILGWFTKYNAGTPENPLAYVFSENINLPVYIFMCAIVAIFLGLMVSAEEIIRDSKILKRESFLHLSRFSYYNSKILFLIVLSAIQSAVFVWIGNSILEIRGLFLHYWLMLFCVSVMANMVGLNISSSLKSVVAIYILIPLLLVPQIILGGAMIRFEKLNSQITNPKYVPVVGDIMVSRWAYEALAVTQFKHNDYQKIFFSKDKAASNAAYKLNYLLPELTLKLNSIERNIKQNKNFVRVEQDLRIVRNEIEILGEQLTGADISFVSQLNPVDFDVTVANKLRKFIEQSRRLYSRVLDNAIDEKDAILYDMKNELGNADELLKFKQQYHNTSLEELVLSKRETTKIQEYKDNLIRINEPVYNDPDMIFGRAHFFASEKRFLKFYIDTYWFNLSIIILMSLVFYLTLLNETLKKLSTFISGLNMYRIFSQWRMHFINAIRPLIKNK
jgi:ABC transport system ATP-binding/permease protein